MIDAEFLKYHDKIIKEHIGTCMVLSATRVELRAAKAEAARLADTANENAVLRAELKASVARGEEAYRQLRLLVSSGDDGVEAYG